MVNSTHQGGGVAEMLPRIISILRELGVPTEWLVLETDRKEFFPLTKSLHNLIHDSGDARLGDKEREIYEAVSREGAGSLRRELGEDGILVVHDPQPLGAGSLAIRETGAPAVWRCHIGLDRSTARTDAAWEFLRPWTEGFGRAVFSAPEYVPSFLDGKSEIIAPGLDPHGHKNRYLSAHKLVGILCNARLSVPYHPVLTGSFAKTAKRLRDDGSFGPPEEDYEIGLLYRPVVVQVSRWDRLKGWRPLLDAFARLKDEAFEPTSDSARHLRRLQIVRLVLAGPDPQSIQDDPEALGVLDELCEAWHELPAPVRRDVAVVTLPMDNRKENALMVNALQRCATIVVQNSLQEGFGLTVMEAMWKGAAVVSTRACGPRHQIRDGREGVLVRNPEDPHEIAQTLDALLANPYRRTSLGEHAQLRVHEEFLVFRQVQAWLRCLDRVANVN
jgi:trehalose synthase